MKWTSTLIVTALVLGTIPAQAIITCDHGGCSGEAPPSPHYVKRHVKYHASHYRANDTAGGAVSFVSSHSGVRVRVNPSARVALQCVVNYVEAAGIRVTAMRGYGPGTVHGSLHPSGRALDINQTDRNVTHPAVPRSVANAAADQCGVVSGARWSYADNGHWNLVMHGQPREPWPRTLDFAASKAKDVHAN